MRLSPASWLPFSPVGLPAVVLFAFLMGIAIPTTRSTYALGDLLVIGLLYLTLAVALSCVAQLLARRGLVLEIAGALVVGAVAAWHVREQLRPAGVGPTLWTVDGMAPFLGTLVVATSVQFVLGRFVADSGSGTRLGRYVVASSLAFGSVLFVSYTSSETLRWHLLRHNTLLGTPAFHLFSPTVLELEEEAWARHRQGQATIAQPDWVHASSYHAGPAPAMADDGGGGDAPERPPDVVFVLLDTLRADVLGDYGGDPSLMPTLNALAKRSLVFTDVLANTSWTRPSVASFFTGLAPEEHGAVGWSFPMSPDVVTMAEVFKRRGYETAAFIANPEAVNQKSGFHRGFDHFELLEDRPRKYARADLATDRVFDWVGRREALLGQQPLFLYIHYMDPHIPYLSSGTDQEPVASDDEAWGLYEDEARFLDAELERLLRFLDQSLSPSRVTLVTSDHGEEFGEHDARGHAQTLYSEVLRIPAILSIEDPARRSSHVVVNDPLEGRHFFELLLRTTETPDEILPLAQSLGRETRLASLFFSKGDGVFHELLRPYRTRIFSRMVQRDGWRLIWSAYGPTRELYDLNADPAETENRVGQRPDLVESLAAEMDAKPPYWRRGGEIDISEESLERLRGLGYIR